MSRIKLPKEDVIQPHHDIFVGWDNPLETFFAQVYDMTILDEDFQLIEWVGTGRKEVFDMSALCVLMEPWCNINNDIRAQLMRDWSERREPTVLQQSMPISRYHLRNRDYWDGLTDSD